MAQELHRLIIDTTTTSKPELIARLRQQSFVVDCRDAGEYKENTTLSKIEIDSHIDEYAVEDWMFEQKGVDFIGVTSLAD